MSARDFYVPSSIVNAMPHDPNYPRDLIGYGRNPPHARLAGRRAHRRAVRAELRGRRRELRAARRPGLGDLPVRDRRRAGVRGAPHEHGVDLRIRLARRRLAPAARVRAAQAAAHGLRRRHGAAAQPGAGRGVRRARPRDRLPRLALDQLPGHRRGDGARAHAPRRCEIIERADRRAAARLVHRPRQPEHAPAGGRARRLRLRRRLLRRRPAVLDGGRHVSDGSTRAAADRALHARHQRHALRRAAGLQHRRRNSSPTCATPSTCSTPKATEATPKMLSVGMHCRLLGRPGRFRGAAALPRPRASSTTASGSARRIDIARHWREHHPYEGGKQSNETTA